VLSQPPPKIFLHAFGDSAVVYEVKYSLDDESRFNDIHDAIHTNIWYEAKRAGLTIPFPIRTIRVERPDRKSGEAHETARSQLQKHALFECLDEGLTQELLSDSRLLRFGRGETIIEQGAPGHSMFVILHGTVEVFVAKGGVTHLVATLATSDAFGEMSLLTGEPRTASVIATTDCELWEIQKPALQAILKESPVLADRLSEMLAKRKLQQEALDSAAPPSAAAVAQQRAALKAGFLRRISTFFEL
jgi:CRP-like cAMP-binding protein